MMVAEFARIQTYILWLNSCESSYALKGEREGESVIAAVTVLLSSGLRGGAFL
jgi:hypothetical protein